MSALRPFPVSQHFHLEPLADGVWAAIHADGGYAICNAGIIDLGGRTLVYDTFMSPYAALDLRAAAAALTGRPVDAVVLSHWHNDHIWGAQAFDAGTALISTEETRRLIIATRGEEDYDGFMLGAEERFERARARLQAAQSESQRREAVLWVDYWQSVIEFRPILQVRKPTVTFTEHLACHGDTRTVEMTAYAGGHTASDAVLYLPQERIAFVSDLLFVGLHPYLGDGHPPQLLAILDDLLATGASVVVPGHGAIGTPADLRLMQEYIRAVAGLAQDAVESGDPEECLDAIPVPEPFAAWGQGGLFRANLHFLYGCRRELGTGL